MNRFSLIRKLLRMLRSGMGRKTLVAAVAAVLIPYAVLIADTKMQNIRQKRIFRTLILLLYIVGMLYLTVISRQVTGEHKINMDFFWSYARIRAADVRWQIYMNVYLFIPFGFMIALCLGGELPKRQYLMGIFLITILSGLLLSIGIELIQYQSCRGLCEFDDVFNNTLGVALGYVLWRVLPRNGIVVK